MSGILTSHPALIAIAAYWVFSAIIGGMPAPDDKSSPGYQWIYSSLHILAGNLTAAIASKYPNLPGVVTTEKTEKTTTIPAAPTSQPPEVKP